MGKWMVALLLLVAVAVQVEGTFASSTGFSGRNVDCTICHAPAAPDATAHLVGAPATWRPGETYPLEASVTGGPTPLPGPQPKGGFELEAEAGTLGPGPGMQGLLRFPEPTTATYEPEGTLRREWALAWTAPAIHEPPADVTLWLAVMAANGNHIIATNTSDGGEQGDAVATLAITVPPAPDVVEAWQALPLGRPVIDRLEQVGDKVRILGHHGDANATHLSYRVAAGPWREQAAAPDFALLVAGDPSLVELRSAGHGRVSAALPAVHAEQAMPAPAGVIIVALWLATRVK